MTEAGLKQDNTANRAAVGRKETVIAVTPVDGTNQDDIKEKSLSADEVYARSTWRHMSCTSNPNKSGNKMEKKKITGITQLDFYTNLFYLLWSHEIVVGAGLHNLLVRCVGLVPSLESAWDTKPYLRSHGVRDALLDHSLQLLRVRQPGLHLWTRHGTTTVYTDRVRTLLSVGNRIDFRNRSSKSNQIRFIWFDTTYLKKMNQGCLQVNIRLVI